MHSTQQTGPGAGSLVSYYNRVRSHTEKLCEPLEIEDYIPQPSVDVSPAKWNIAHTTWFFEEMILKQFVPGYKVFDPDFGFLFNSYYNTIGERTPRDRRGDLSRPTVKRVFEYRRHVDEHMAVFLTTPEAASCKELIVLGLSHEEQHQELLLADLKYSFGVNPLFPIYKEGYMPETTGETGSPSFLQVSGGEYEIGYAGDGFCFDNEQGRHTVRLDEFEIGSRLVRNSEFVKFIQDGGYLDHRLWHSEGWDWVNQNQICAPMHWHKLHDGRNGFERPQHGITDEHTEWYQFTLGGLQKLNMDVPVCHISYYEAAAFAEWKGMRLPTEFEWETASSRFDWGLRWEWTNSAYLPYPGFKKSGGAVGEYNGKFMINQMVLRGASVVTPEGHSRPTYRNFFHPHLRWQFTGLRLAR